MRPYIWAYYENSILQKLKNLEGGQIRVVRKIGAKYQVVCRATNPVSEIDYASLFGVAQLDKGPSESLNE